MAYSGVMPCCRTRGRFLRLKTIRTTTIGTSTLRLIEKDKEHIGVIFAANGPRSSKFTAKILRHFGRS